MPNSSILWSSSLTFGIKGSGILWGAERANGLAHSCKLIWYSPWIVPKPRKSFGNLTKNLSTSCTAWILAMRSSASTLGHPKRDFWSCLKTYICSSATELWCISLALNWLETSSWFCPGPMRRWLAGCSVIPCSWLNTASGIMLASAPLLILNNNGLLLKCNVTSYGLFLSLVTSHELFLSLISVTEGVVSVPRKISDSTSKCV